jgi:putative FmdB family regulatory protein
MPIYEYRCGSCKTVFEKIVTLEEYAKRQPCVECGRCSDRIYSAVHFKEFIPYYDKRAGKVIAGSRESERTDKKTNRVQVRDLPWFKEFKSEQRRATRKPIFSTDTAHRTSKAQVV